MEKKGVSPRGYTIPADLKAQVEKANLRRIHPWIFYAKLILLVLLLTAMSGGVISSTGLAKFPLQMAIGVLLAHAVELVHQCLHRTATGRTATDQRLGMLLGQLGLVSFWHYQYWHLWHHKYNGTEQDQESFGYAYEMLQSRSRMMRVLGFFWHLSQLQHYYTAFSRMGLAVRGQLALKLQATTPQMPDRTAHRIQRDYQIMAAMLSLMVLTSFVWHSTLVWELWIVPLLLAYGPAHALIELPEHFQCDRPTPEVFRNTRTIQAGWFMRWLTNANNLHVEHHNDPHIPMENLPALARSLQTQKTYKYLEDSYLRFHARLLSSLWQGRPMSKG